MIKLVNLLNEEQNIQELGAKDIALGAAMAASSIFGGAKAQTKIPTDKPAITQSITQGKTNPNFWVSDTNDIKSVQKAIKDYRAFSIAKWKKDKQIITMSGQKMDPNKPEDVDRVEKNYMLWCLGTSEDGKNGKYTSQFEFPGAFLEDKDTKEREDLGLGGNKQMTSTSSSSGITVQQMKEWNAFVKWMKENKYSGKEDMDHAQFRDNVLKQYKGQVKESKMNKQQIREAIRRVIKEELNEKTYPKAGEKGNINASQLKKGDILAGSNLEVVSVSTGAKTPSGKVEVTVKNPKNGKEVTKTWGKSTVVKVKNKTNENAPAPSKPAPTKEPAVAPGKPAEKKPRRPLGNPNVQPGPKAEATMKEAEMLKQVIKRFKSKK